MNETLSNISDAMDYANEQVSNESLDPEIRDAFLEDATVLQVVLDIIDKHFGPPDPLHHWFWRADYEDKD